MNTSISLLPLPETIFASTSPVQDITSLFTEDSSEPMTLTAKLTLQPEKQYALAMDSVGSKAKLYCNDKLLKEHYGGFTQWDCLLPKGTEKANLRLELSDCSGETSPYQPAGILRSLSLVELPATYFTEFLLQNEKETPESYLLTADYGLSDEAFLGEIIISLETTAGELVVEKSFSKGESVRVSCPKVKEWHPEHPHLYRVKVTLEDSEGNALETLHFTTGFTHIETKERQVFVSGVPTKLRGICYREPLSGLEKTDFKRDLELFKQANINYIRGLYYPFSQEMLAYCDELGFFVENVAPVYEVGEGVKETQNLPDFETAYLTQATEMVKGSLHHPSILLWLLGCRSAWGTNQQAVYDSLKKLDPKRLLNFHFPMAMQETDPLMDVWSCEYVSHLLPLDYAYDQMKIFHTHGADNPIGYATGGMEECPLPILHDKIAQIPCYNRDQIQRDGGIREFWGRSIRLYADKLWETKAALGGAVMAAVDETDSFSPALAQHHWGILTASREKKPEYFHVQQAYSPVQITEIIPTTDGYQCTIENRFAATNLKEISFDYGGESIAVSAAPGKTVTVSLPKSAIPLLTVSQNGREILRAQLEESPPILFTAPKKSPPLSVTEHEKVYKITSDTLSYSLSKETGMLTGGLKDKAPGILDGPHLVTTGLKLEEWSLTSLEVKAQKEKVTAVISGRYGKICAADFILTFSTDGTIKTEYSVREVTMPMPHTVKILYGLDTGGLEELGTAFTVAPSFSQLFWQRKTGTLSYPEYHIGRGKGKADKENKADFFSMKHTVDTAKLSSQDMGTAIIIKGHGEKSIRLANSPSPETVLDDRDSRISYLGTWHQMDDYTGNYLDTESLSDEKGASATLTFTGTGIQVYGPTDLLFGKLDIELDGKIVASGISQYPDAVDFPNMSRGYEKRYQLPLFKVCGLSDTQHTLRVLVTGEAEEGSQGNYVSLDYFKIVTPKHPDRVKLIINEDFNYTRLAYGNYTKEKIELEENHIYQNTIRLMALEEEK